MITQEQFMEAIETLRQVYTDDPSMEEDMDEYAGNLLQITGLGLTIIEHEKERI